MFHNFYKMNSSIQEYIQNIRNIQSSILCFIENNQNNEENYQNLIQLFDDYKILNDPHETKLILTLISRIGDQHYHTLNFFEKIEQVLKFFQPIFQKFFSNKEIFDIFSPNKRIILFLITEKIIIIDKVIVEKMYINQFIQYFTPEIKEFFKNFSDKEQKELLSYDEHQSYYYKQDQKYSLDIDLTNNNYNRKDNNGKEDDDNNNTNEEEESNGNGDDDDNNNNDEEDNSDYDDNDADIDLDDNNLKLIQKIPDDFYEKRKIGENDNEICEIIRKDSIEEFITYVKKTNYSLSSRIKPSIYETNVSLLYSKPNLIKYAAFFGSVQIFKYLYQNNVKQHPSLWIYAAHSDNSEMISTLEENKIIKKKYNKTLVFKRCFEESIKCHHNDVSNYIQNNYFHDENKYHIKHYNFAYIEIDKIITDFYYYCKYGYYKIVNLILSTKNANLKFSKSKYDDSDEFIDGIKYKTSRKLISIKTVLYAALKNKDIDITKLLLSSEKVDVNSYNIMTNNNVLEEKTALYIAVEERDLDTIKFLLSCPGIDVNQYNKMISIKESSEMTEKTALFLAAEEGFVDVVKLLLESPRINVNIVNIIYSNTSLPVVDRITALFVAINRHKTDMVKLLLSHPGTDVNLVNSFYDDTELIDSDTDRDKTYNACKYEFSPLHASIYFCYGNKCDIVELLLKNKNVDTNIKAKCTTERIRRDYFSHEIYDCDVRDEEIVFFLFMILIIRH